MKSEVRGDLKSACSPRCLVGWQIGVVKHSRGGLWRRGARKHTCIHTCGHCRFRRCQKRASAAFEVLDFTVLVETGRGGMGGARSEREREKREGE